jgi:hypothetical protein
VLCNDFMNGTSFYGWLHQHVLGHHVYCNSYGIDPDVRPFPLRLAPCIVRAQKLPHARHALCWWWGGGDTGQ